MRKTYLLFLMLICAFIVNTKYALALAKQLKDTYTLQTDDTLIGLVVKKDGLFLSRLSNGLKGWNWIKGNSEIVMPKKVFYKNNFRQLKWELDDVKTESDHNASKAEITFINRTPLLKARSVWLAHPGPGPIEHTLTLENPSDESIKITWAPSLNLSLDSLPQSKIQHWGVEKGAGGPSDYGTHVTKIKNGFDYTGISLPYLGGNDPIPWQCIDAGNYGIYTGIESTACVMQKTKLLSQKYLKITLGIEKPEKFRAKLAPEEVYALPTVFAGCYKGDVDDGCNRLHRWVERWLCPTSTDTNLPLLTNNSWGGSMNVDEKLAIRMIDAGADVGVEMYHLDAGWFNACGWWEPDLNKFPNGMKFVSNYAHSKGLKFGLWLAWTLGGGRKALAGGDEALSVFNPKMKNWFGEDVDPNWESPIPWEGKIVCLACEPAKQWCLNMLRSKIKNYKLDLLEHDIGLIVPDCIRTNHGHTRTRGDISHRCCESYYQIYDTLIKEFPDLLLENCVGGGRQVDFGVVKHTHYTCSIDVYDPLSLRKAFYDTSFPMPPRIIEGYVSDHRGKTIEHFRYCIRSAMLGWCTIMMDIAQWTEEQKVDGRKQFEIYKKVIRPQIRDGNLYHVSNRPTPNGWDAFEYYTPATGKGVILAFREKYEKSEVNIKLKGTKIDEKYNISFEDDYGKPKTYIGRELMENGIKVNLPFCNSSELIYITKK